MMKYGAQLYSAREYCRDQEGVEATLRRVKDQGFDVVQISGFGPGWDVDKTAALVQELELDVCVIHTPWDRLANPAELMKVIAEHKKLGCYHLGLGMKPDSIPTTWEGYTRFFKKVNQICEIAEGEGLTFGYHNHDLEYQKFNGEFVFDRMIEECPKAYFIYDVFWAQAGGANPLTWIEKLKGRIKVIHIKDYRMIGRVRQYAEIGQGSLEWDKIIPLCEKTGIPYAVIEQDADFLEDPFESFALSRMYLKDMGYWK